MRYFLIIILFSTATFALPKGEGIKFFADNIYYNQKQKIVTAKGNVEAVQEVIPCTPTLPHKDGGSKCFRIIKADKIIYDRKKDKIKAVGNVYLMNEDGIVSYADNIELTRDFKKGLIENIKTEFVEGGIFTAEKAEHNEPETKLTNASFTTCKECKGKSPIWKIKAKEIIYNKVKQEISYKHAILEAYAIPIFYVPYFFHPSPDADRKTGFLAPSFKENSDLGMQVSTPYYINLAPTYDATITPTITSKEGLILSGEFRQLLKSGYYQFFASGTIPQDEDKHDCRGHIEGYGNFNISNDWQWGFYGKRSSDNTYLDRYDFGNEDTLTSSLFINYLDDNTLFNTRTISFQGLRTDDNQDTIPLVLPSMDYRYKSKPLFWNSNFIVNANTIGLFRDEGNDIGRAVLEGGLQIPKIIYGSKFDLSLWLRGDLYRIKDDFGNTDYEERIIPTAYLGWKHPLIKQTKNSKIIIEPVAEFIATPHNINNNIPNEDSQSLDFSATNLFTRNRYTGYDRVESGFRVNYGLRTELNLYKNHNISGVIGQVYRDGDEIFAGSGNDDFSYIVGQSGYSYNKKLSLDYKFKLDDLELKISELSSKLDISPVKLNLEYTKINDDLIIPDIEEVYLGGTLNITDKWRIGGYGKQDMIHDEMLESGATIGFENECVNISVDYKKEYTSYKDVSGGDSFKLNVELKTVK